MGIVGMAVAMQATQAPVVPVGPQGSSQAANPRPIAGIIVFNWPMRKLKIEIKHCPGSLSVVSTAVSVSVDSVLSLSELLLARAGGVS